MNSTAVSTVTDKNERRAVTPDLGELEAGLREAKHLVDDVILKNYLSNLSKMDIVLLDESLKKPGSISLFKITKMVYQKDEYSTYKLASVFNSVQNLNCGVFIIADSEGPNTEFYMGVRSFDGERNTESLKDTLENTLRGQFPGVKTENFIEKEKKAILERIKSNNVAAVSCVAKNKDEEFTDNERFIQGLEKLAIAMQGQRYTAVILAKSTPPEQLLAVRNAYEQIYTQLSPFASMQLSYGTNTAMSVTNAFSRGTSYGTSHTKSYSKQTGTSSSTSETVNESTTKQNALASVAKGAGIALIGAASLLAAPFTGGVSLVAGAAAGAIVGNLPIASKTKGTSKTTNHAENTSETYGESDTVNENTNESTTNTWGLTSGNTENLQLTSQNKNLLNTLERIDLQLKRLDECESLGLWECAAYFLSDTQETAEMAAGTYRALMKGEKSGVETSAINFWGRGQKSNLPFLREYLTNFIHPVFAYETTKGYIPVTAASLVSSNELAIQMGLPRKSVCGFPVIEHADFGKEVVSYEEKDNPREFSLGKVFNMGHPTETEVRLDCNSLTMHTFITGATGSGKSNTVYEILNQLRAIYCIPFLVIEPAKGEYKNIFGHLRDISVYGTNPKKTKMLKINPFSFPSEDDGIHVLEHLDRLVELFNVCWPMYAAMPAILKEAMENAYISAGWDLRESTNSKGSKVFPNFSDLHEEIKKVVKDSEYSDELKGNFIGALCTRVQSLTTGINGTIFSADELSDKELFDNNVIVDLSRVGSMETKSLIMGLLVMKLNEYRMTSGEMNSELLHVTVLEEAHNLLKRTSTEQPAEGSNLLGKSVEMLANSIAEMRTYGEGFIIADQSPGLLDLSVIRNTNTKIIMRLPEKNDRELVGFAANLNETQITELAKLETGVAAIYQNNWIEPVLVKVNKSALQEAPYVFTEQNEMVDISGVRRQLINMLIHGRMKREKLDFDVYEIERNLSVLNLTSKSREFIEDLLAEYKKTETLNIWNDENFRRLSRLVVHILGVRSRVENYVKSSADKMELTEKLSSLAKQLSASKSAEVALTLSHIFMQDLTDGIDEQEKRGDIYERWNQFIQEGGAKYV